MRAAVFHSYGEDPVVENRPAPACPPDGVVVRVRATGVCRSDWHAWQGHDPVPLPHVPGHEFAGVIARVGERVGRWAVGDRVTVPFVVGCGRCEVCLSGDPQVCPDQSQPGFTYDGSFAEYVAVPAADFNLVRLPDSLPFTAAAALGCRFATAFRALIAHGRVRREEWVAVFGCGGVGLSAVTIASALGARVVAVDVSAEALDRARSMGARHTLLTDAGMDPDSVARAVRELTGEGAHLTVDAYGSASNVMACLRSLRRRGRHVQVGLLLGADAVCAVPMDRILAWEIEIHGSHGIAAADYPDLFRLLDEHDIDLARLIGRTISLDRAGAALRAMSGGSEPGITVIAMPDAP
ncbi:zinc-dependent alcohol dehydrogenase family protein [Streptomyces lushanensis]|uniref:zinc-dependent alcohol dehydrogenase family protein n=1 Tax=Streptomyces lushanensis TaxID=1434255 RepID=UPI000831B38F|nr:zinc-dependent alcohol dehydrogenase family protein [Streptomyces lushanensis]